MITQAKIQIKQWDEKSFDEPADAGKLTRVSVSKEYTGGLVGKGTLEFLMAYGPAGVTYVGLERFTGSLDGRTGSFVLQIEGRYEAGAPAESVRVLADSATGELIGLEGGGKCGAGADECYVMDLDYECPALQ